MVDDGYLGRLTPTQRCRRQTKCAWRTAGATLGLAAAIAFKRALTERALGAEKPINAKI